MDSNRQFLQSRFPGVWEEFSATSSLPAPTAGLFDFNFPGGTKLSLPIRFEAFEEEHQRNMVGMGSYAGALVWGANTPEELEMVRREFPNRPFVYVESDPVAFSQVLSSVDLSKLCPDRASRIAFVGDCGRLMSEIVLGLGESEAAASRIYAQVSPRLFLRLLREDHPLGQFVCHIVRNVYLNQSEDEFNRRRALQAKGTPLKDIFPTVYLYRALLKWLQLLAVTAPGIRTLYREMPATPAPSNVATVSIVVLAWNRWDLTERCLKSIFSHPLPEQTEVLVVDNGSTDMTSVELKKLSQVAPPLRILTLPKNLGPAGGRDAALDVATGRTLVFLDNDVAIQHDRWLEILLEPLATHPRIGACGAFGVVHSHDESDAWFQKVLLPGLAAPVSWISSFCIAVRRQALVDCGGWRSELYHLYGMEDVSLGWALREAGWVAAVPGQFVPIVHGMNHRDGHYDYDYNETGRKNSEHFLKLWGPRRRILNLARGNQTLAGEPVRREALRVSDAT